MDLSSSGNPAHAKLIESSVSVDGWNKWESLVEEFSRMDYDDYIVGGRVNALRMLFQSKHLVYKVVHFEHKSTRDALNNAAPAAACFAKDNLNQFQHYEQHEQRQQKSDETQAVLLSSLK